MHCALIRICARLSWDSITQDSGSFRASNAMAYEYDDAISIIKEMYEMQCGSRPGCRNLRRQRHFRNWRNRTQKTETKNANALVSTNGRFHTIIATLRFW